MTPEAWVALYKAMLIGSVMGILSALMGVGGGVIAVPAMMYLMGFDIKLASGTSLAAMVVVSLAGAIKHYTQGSVDPATAGGIILTGVVFALIGAWLNKMLPAMWLQRIFAVFLACMAVQVFWRTISTPDKPPAEAAKEKPEEPAQ
ncbi:MAG: sulfite exporter TauE/SafE family protein [Planctomycetes bacterium]|nr:sulfite exporter TauE/SafE family protein [Planctomycetota bacterium]